MVKNRRFIEDAAILGMLCGVCALIVLGPRSALYAGPESLKSDRASEFASAAAGHSATVFSVGRLKDTTPVTSGAKRWLRTVRAGHHCKGELTTPD